MSSMKSCTQHAHCFNSDARRQPVIVYLDFFAPKYPALNSGTITEFLLKNEAIVIIYYYNIYFDIFLEAHLDLYCTQFIAFDSILISAPFHSLNLLLLSFVQPVHCPIKVSHFLCCLHFIVYTFFVVLSLPPSFIHSSSKQTS